MKVTRGLNIPDIPRVFNIIIDEANLTLPINFTPYFNILRKKTGVYQFLFYSHSLHDIGHIRGAIMQQSLSSVLTVVEVTSVKRVFYREAVA